MLPDITHAHCIRRAIVARVHIMHVIITNFILFSTLHSDELLKSLLNNSDPGVRPNVDGKYNARGNILLT